MQELKAQCVMLEQELRKSKRREEKLTALQYRLKEDVRLMGADTRSVGLQCNPLSYTVTPAQFSALPGPPAYSHIACYALMPVDL